MKFSTDIKLIINYRFKWISVQQINTLDLINYFYFQVMPLAIKVLMITYATYMHNDPVPSQVELYYTRDVVITSLYLSKIFK